MGEKTTGVLSGLNEQQKKAVIATEGYVRVIAGAGSGKTRALAHRFAYLVNEKGISPRNIMCVTFTNKAAREMKLRIKKLIGDNIPTGYLSTFHGFCLRMLKEDCHVVQYPRRLKVIDEEDVKSILRECFSVLGITTREFTVKKAMEYINKKKKSDDYIELLADESVKALLKKRTKAETIEERVYYEYLYEQHKIYGLDFTDLIAFSLFILENDKKVCLKWQKRMKYIMVDEFQDVSERQYDLACILSDYHQNLFVVGDPDQTIYTWRGAKVRYILDFDKNFPSTKIITMEENYRSLPKILDASNALIQKNEYRLDKNLIPIREGKGKVLYFHAEINTEEADWVSKKISSLHKKGVNLSDIALLYRAHYVSRSFEEAFIRGKIKYIIYSGVSFYARKEIKDILSYLRLITDGDNHSFLRVVNEPKRGVGKKRIDFIKKYAEENKCSFFEALDKNINNSLFSERKVKEFREFIIKYRKKYKKMKLSDLLSAVLDESGYEVLVRKEGDENRLDNLAELKQSILEYEEASGEEFELKDYLNDIALLTNTDTTDRANSVKLMTIHSAKGLEFPYVFVCGLSEGIFPSSKAVTKRKLEEERRLAYVAFTRAEDRLYLTDSGGFNHVNQSEKYPSRFIFDAEQENISYVRELSEEIIEEYESVFPGVIKKQKRKRYKRKGDSDN